MAFILSNIVSKTCVKSLEDKLLALSISASGTQIRERHIMNPPPRLRNPTWFTKKHRVVHNDEITTDNQEFVKEVVQDKYSNKDESPLLSEIAANAAEWQPTFKRTGVIARKIGIYPIWMKDGTKMTTTLLQVLDNHVIKYYTPEEYENSQPNKTRVMKKKGCLLLGAEGTDPSLLTKEYCGLFKNSGVIPKKFLARFFVSPDAALPPGTPINALHFQVGNFVDVRGKTIDRGFQGVMKRHGFKGMPASHGVTKTHRRGGNIGGGGEKARVWPGTKMPGHMGNRYRVLKGLKIWRINTKYNVLYVSGQNVPGDTNSIVTIYDTILPLRKPSNPVPFPTYLNTDEIHEEDLYDDDVHQFCDPTIEYNET
ncbi:PREDICTED: 39S ribosomal protein L3, mitochondrial [Nicrophorus vespilloides]|uniref:Large ribosomal subunit protein uL3m n=1 Tax=Nicrophorus vespilloides TaxID=110193 RepID=A0ABM1NGT6_NICVS|nr:PREDICTED: 39S ribosomal protein L3, mitochondrial [Nicrophorus vespilloides]